MTEQVIYEVKRGNTTALVPVIAAELAQMHDGVKELVIDDVGFTIYYDERGATGDNGAPVPGDVVGDFEVREGLDGPLGLRFVANVHVSPHGTSGYGNPHAKGYSARLAAEAIVGRYQQRTGTTIKTGDDN